MIRMDKSIRHKRVNVRSMATLASFFMNSFSRESMHDLVQQSAEEIMCVFDDF